MRYLSLCLAAAAGLSWPAYAQTPAAPAAAAPAAAPAAPAAAPAADPVVARVGGEDIRRSDLADAMELLPEQYRSLPQAVLYPKLLDQLVDRKIIAIAARKQGLDKDPAIQRQMARADEQVLQTALLQKEIAPKLTDEALRARYDQTIKTKPGEEEVHARHILVADEAQAKSIIEQLNKGANFADLAKQYSTDPSAKAGGGDLGFFKKGDMVPAFADAAFALKPGETTKEPVKTQFGWHIIKVEERRTAPPEPFEQVRNDIQQEMIQEEVGKLLAQARNGVPVERFNADGTTPRATDGAEPPPATPTPGK